MTGSIIIRVDRPVVEAGIIDEATDILEGCGHDAQTIRVSIGAVTILMSGYDDDSRELYNIEGPRRWLARLMEEVPHMPIFLNFDTDSVELLLLATCPLSGPTGTGISGADLKAWIQGRFLYINLFLRSKGLLLDSADLKPWTDRFVSMIGQMTGQS